MELNQDTEMTLITEFSFIEAGQLSYGILCEILRVSMKNKKSNNFLRNSSFGFGLVDSIVSISLLGIVVSYSIYFATKRMDILFSSNLNRSINKEIKRDIDLLRSDFWAMGLNTSEKKYLIDDNSCMDIEAQIIGLPNWDINQTRPNLNSPAPPFGSNEKIQYWWPDQEKGKIFKGRGFLIVRELIVKSFKENSNLDKNISNINYRVKWNDNNVHWMSIDLGTEAHSWCL